MDRDALCQHTPRTPPASHNAVMSLVQTPNFTSGFWVCPAPNTVYVPANDTHRNCTTAQHTPISGNVDIDGTAVAVGSELSGHLLTYFRR